MSEAAFAIAFWGFLFLYGGLMYAISSTTEPDYLVDHSASIVLINPDAQLAAVFKPELAAGKVPLVSKAMLLADFPLVMAKLK